MEELNVITRQQGERITSQDLQQARERKSVYAKWLEETIFGLAFNVVMVHPVGDYEPFYRDVYRPLVTVLILPLKLRK